jgi:hypothetical protein
VANGGAAAGSSAASGGAATDRGASGVGAATDGGASSSGGAPSDGLRLELVLDLDHTLVHAAEMARDQRPAPGAHTFSLVGPGGLEQRFKLKVRDGVRAFLKEVRTFCTLHVYTMGSLSYTRQVLHLLDPTRAIDGEILCRSDGDEQPFEKSIEHFHAVRGEAGGEGDGGGDGGGDGDGDGSGGGGGASHARRTRMVIIDDREDAWCATSRPHVLSVPQFRCWQDDGSLMPPRPEADATLLDMLTVLRAVHRDLATGGATSVPSALALRRGAVLSGCVLVFSGGLLKDQYKPELNPLWRMALALGARCETSFDTKAVTHVVSASAETASVRKALLHSIFAVSQQWLLDSFMRWHRQEEALYSHAPRPPGAAAAGSSGAGGGSGAHGGGRGGAAGASAAAASGGDQGARVERAIRLARHALASDAHTPSQRLSAAIHYLVPAEHKAEAREQLRRFEDANGKDAAAAAAALTAITVLVGRDALQQLVAELAG